MHENEEDRTLDRRRLIRRAGTVAAGVAGAGAIGAVAATPAQADTGGPFILGQANVANETTKLTMTPSNLAKPALRLENPNAAAGAAVGAPLSLGPLVTTGDPANPNTWLTQIPSTQAPAGSVFADDFGDLHTIGEPLGGALGAKFSNMLYSTGWSTMVVPTGSFRYMDTRTALGRQFILPGSANYDPAFRVLPKNSSTVPDLILDLSPIFLGGFCAVQANFTALLPVAQGFAALWDEGDWLGTSSINYTPSVAEIANFTQTVVGSDLRIRLKTQRACQFILDIVGYVVVDPFAQFNPSFNGGAGAQSARGAGPAVRWQRRVR